MQGKRSWIPLLLLSRMKLSNNTSSSEWSIYFIRYSITDLKKQRLFRAKLDGHVFLTHSMSNFAEEHTSSICHDNSPDVFDTASQFIRDSSCGFGLQFNQKQQERACAVLGHATIGKPSYVDPETGDNAWHALSRLSIDALPRGELLSQIRLFLNADVDLNLPNKEEEYPLVAFICGRPSLTRSHEETGAQRSKYLETLMWKDPRAHGRIPNPININIRDRSGASALYYAALSGQPESVKSLIERGANVNVRLSKPPYLLLSLPVVAFVFHLT
jgi:hypothetical protein